MSTKKSEDFVTELLLDLDEINELFEEEKAKHLFMKQLSKVNIKNYSKITFIREEFKKPKSPKFKRITQSTILIKDDNWRKLR
jgi:predicted type IV restriction endonuclease